MVCHQSFEDKQAITQRFLPKEEGHYRYIIFFSWDIFSQNVGWIFKTGLSFSREPLLWSFIQSYWKHFQNLINLYWESSYCICQTSMIDDKSWDVCYPFWSWFFTTWSSLDVIGRTYLTLSADSLSYWLFNWTLLLAFAIFFVVK